MNMLCYCNGIIFITKRNRRKASSKKTIVRLGLIQWQMRLYKDLEELMQQAEYFVDAVSGYWSDFALFTEFFNAPLMAGNNHLPESEAIGELSKHTEAIVQKFSELAIIVLLDYFLFYEKIFERPVHPIRCC